MKAEVIENANVLTPNTEHKNFTETSEIIKKGTILVGEPKTIKGRRRGEDFNYRLFVIKENNKIIYLKKIKPMQVTEVTLGADAQPSPTLVKVPEGKKLLSQSVIMYTVAGAGLGFGWSKYKKFDNKKTTTYSVIGAVVGFAIGKYMEKRKAITVKPSK
jgi:hypothetical protein